MEFTAAATYNGIIGLSQTETNQDYTTVQFGVLPNVEGNVYLYESGSTYASGDVFRVSVESGGSQVSQESGSALISEALCVLCVLCVSVVNGFGRFSTTETQRTQSMHREKLKQGGDEYECGPCHFTYATPLSYNEPTLTSDWIGSTGGQVSHVSLS